MIFVGFSGEGEQGAEQRWVCCFGGRGGWGLPLLQSVQIIWESTNKAANASEETETRVIGNPSRCSASRRDNSGIY